MAHAGWIEVMRDRAIAGESLGGARERQVSSSSAFQYRKSRQLSGAKFSVSLIRTAGTESGRRGARSRCMPASAGVRPPFRRLHETQQVTMFSQSLRPPWATGTTWSKVSSAVGNARAQYWQV